MRYAVILAVIVALIGCTSPSEPPSDYDEYRLLQVCRDSLGRAYSGNVTVKDYGNRVETVLDSRTAQLFTKSEYRVEGILRRWFENTEQRGVFTFSPYRQAECEVRFRGF